MGALANAALLSRDGVFRDRVLAAVIFHARAVLSESPDTPNHIFRAQYARSVLLSPMDYMDSFSWTIAADLQIASLGDSAAAIPEDKLLARVGVAWDALITPLAD